MPGQKALETTGPQDKALAALRAEGEPLFGVLDAARSPRVLKLLRKAREEYASLYEGPEGRELAEVAPYLVRLPPGSALLEDLVREGWGHNWGVFLTSPMPFRDTRRHLRKFLKVRDESTGEQLYFRFYDPRVLQVFLPSCTPEQRREFRGPLGAFLMEDGAGRVLHFKPSGEPPTTEGPTPAAPFRIRKEQMEAFAEASRKDFENRMVAHLGEEFPAEAKAMGEPGLRELIRQGIQRAQGHRILQEEDVRRYLHLLMVFGKEFERDPAFSWAEALLSRLEEEPSARIEQVYAQAREREAEP
jgi:hypothetical protein